jgi:hypothetical protein
MISEEIFKVVEKLCGSIEPVADAAIDSQRMQNIVEYIDVMEKMYYEIACIARRHKDSPYGSQKEIAMYCHNHLKNLEYENH